ncbi:hypothetical protein [Anaerotignum sp.]|uniref:hypothetical protein n=1 Tax=Anaerotignum sp. TaxID=2039241 RepID=UPI0028A9DC6A|nr:hypothetical protein [Anaerotignum sp.]
MNEHKTKDQALHAKRMSIAVSIVFATAILGTLLFIGTYKYRHTFSTERWNEDVECRAEIVSDMLKKHKLVGMSESDMIALLETEDSEQSSFKMSEVCVQPA